MFVHFVIYGLLGWCVEVLWTSFRVFAVAVLERRPVDWRLPARTYMWMFPIYGAGGLVFEAVYMPIEGWAWPLRGAVYVAGCFVIEYITGWSIRSLIGVVPWDYSEAKFHVHSLIRLDYAPLWFLFGFFLEFISRVVNQAAPLVHSAAIAYL